MNIKQKGFIGLIVFGILVVLAGVGFFMVTDNIEPGFVGYIYDRTIDPDNPGENSVPVLEGTSVINQPRYGLVWLNPFTQEMYISPTTIISRNWTKNEQEGSKQDDSIEAGTVEGKNVIVDIYMSVQPENVAKIIKNWGVKKDFETIVDDELYGVMKGEVKKVTRKTSVYNFQAKVSDMQTEIFENLRGTLSDKYGIKLIRFEFGNILVPREIQEEINRKTSAINEVELAELDAQRQAEVNAKEVARQEAESKQELIQRQAAADADAYEKERKADAEAYSIERKAEAIKMAANNKYEAAILEKKAELEKQQAYTDVYFADRKLDLQTKAVTSINDKMKIIVTPEDGSGIGSMPGIMGILNEISGAME
jgi:regulator of protease activity HflC (stomatin/prohibitin superfamily)